MNVHTDLLVYLCVYSVLSYVCMVSWVKQEKYGLNVIVKKTQTLLSL